MAPECILVFPDATTAEANRLAANLADAVRDIDPGVLVERRRERSDTQDFGASLAIMLGTAAATAIAKGIGAWLARNSGVRVEIKRKGETVLVATHLDSKDVSRLASLLSDS